MLMKLFWFCSSFLIFLSAILLLIIFWNNKFCRMAGFYSIIPWVSTFGVDRLFYINAFHSTDFKTLMIISILIEFILAAPIVYCFRQLYKMRFAIPWMLLIFAIFRWVWLIIYVLSKSRVMNYFEASLNYFY